MSRLELLAEIYKLRAQQLADDLCAVGRAIDFCSTLMPWMEETWWIVYEAYRDAGFPFGTTQEAMALWWEYDMLYTAN